MNIKKTLSLPHTLVCDFKRIFGMKEIYAKHADICKTLSNPVRLEIIGLLRNKKRNVNELVKLAKISQSNISQHLTILRQNSIVLTTRKGKNIYYKLAYPEMIKACDIMRNILFKQLRKSGALAKSIKK